MRVHSFQGRSTPLLTPGQRLSDQVVTLEAGAQLQVDFPGSRVWLRGPARARFVVEPRPAVLVGQGAFALQRSLGGPRTAPGVVVLPEGVLEVRAAAQLVGRTGPGARVEVIAGGVRALPAGQWLGAGQGARLAEGSLVVRPLVGAAKLEPRLVALQVADQKAPAWTTGELAQLRSVHQAALASAWRAFKGSDLPAAAQTPMDALSRRRALASQAAARIRAREALGIAFDRYRAALLRGERAAGDAALLGRVGAVLRADSP